MLRKIKTLLTITLPVIILALAFLAFNSSAAIADTANECNIDQYLQGTLNKNHAVVTNYSTNPSCVYIATLALYDVPLAPGTPRWIDTQTLLKSQTVAVEPGKTVDVVVDAIGPSCLVQADLIRGKDLLEPPFYANAMAVAVYQVPCEIVQAVPTATPTPASASAYVLTPTPTPTNIPQGPTTAPPGPTGAPSPQSSNSESSSQGVLAFTGNATFIYALILSGAASLISGLILKKFTK